jgi:hypothetical protein
MIFVADIALGFTTVAAVKPGAEVASFAEGAAESPAIDPEPDVGPGAATVPEAGAPADASCGFCAAGWLAGAEAGGVGGGIGPASCAAAGSAHPAAMSNRSACCKWIGLFVI